MKEKKTVVLKEKEQLVKEKSEINKVLKLNENKIRNRELNERERDLSRKTNKLFDELASTCDDSPFNKALLKLLGNMKGNFILFLLCLSK